MGIHSRSYHTDNLLFEEGLLRTHLFMELFLNKTIVILISDYRSSYLSAMRLFKAVKLFVESFIGKGKGLSDTVQHIVQVLDETSTENEFFDSVYAFFESYDCANSTNENRNFQNDIDFIIGCTQASLTAPEQKEVFAYRVDAYLYILQRITEYIHMAKTSTNRLNELRKCFLQELGHTFELSKGSSPNLHTINPDVVQRINIQQYFQFVTEISDPTTMLQFLALCKIVFQSCSIINQHRPLKWRDLFEKVKQWRLSLKVLASLDTAYYDSFKQYPVDADAFICLISQIHPPGKNSLLLVEELEMMLDRLNLNKIFFFERYKPLFAEYIRCRKFNIAYVNQLIHRLAPHNALCCDYLDIYSSCTPVDDIWSMFLYFGKNYPINMQMEQYWIKTLTNVIAKISSTIFKQWCRQTKNCSRTIMPSNQTSFLKILHVILNLAIDKGINATDSECRYKESDLKELLSILIELPVSPSSNPPFLLVRQHLLFSLDRQVFDKFEKIVVLFNRVKNIDEKWFTEQEPEMVIQDDWLRDYMYEIPRDWLNLYCDKYQRLCRMHDNNRWSLHIWSRLLHISFSRLDANDWNELLVKLNFWMARVKHDEYVDNDPLTAIFVNTIFETILVKNSKSAISLPNIEHIIEYIIDAWKGKSRWFDLGRVDEFLQNVQKIVSAIFLLEGK